MPSPAGWRWGPLWWSWDTPVRCRVCSRCRCLVAAEMVAGDSGLGYLLWQSFEVNAIAQVIVCMISIGIAGYFSSALIRALGGLATPWLRTH